jgi:vacuolar-type H+-ATPase subunit H
MSANDTLQSVWARPSVPPEISIDENLASFISSLIEQNAELTQRIEQLVSQKKLADEILAEVGQQANVIGLLAEKEVNRRAATIISDAEEKARAEAVRILAEATQQAQANSALTEKQASDRAAANASESEARAKIEADKILAEAKQKAEEIIEQKTQFAIQQGLLIINKAEQKSLSILQDVRKQAEAIASNANKKVRL